MKNLQAEGYTPIPASWKEIGKLVPEIAFVQATQLLHIKRESMAFRGLSGRT